MQTAIRGHEEIAAINTRCTSSIAAQGDFQSGVSNGTKGVL